MASPTPHSLRPETRGSLLFLKSFCLLSHIVYRNLESSCSLFISVEVGVGWGGGGERMVAKKEESEVLDVGMSKTLP